MNQSLSGIEPREESTSTKSFKPFIQLNKVGPAFWTITSTLSLVINLALIVLVIILSSQLFALKRTIQDQLVAGLYKNFVLMDQANIKSTIPVNAEVPAKFNLAIDKDLEVTLTEDTPIKGASVSVDGGYITISNAPTHIILPAGTKLPIHLKMIVPVDQKIPVNLDVNVNIPLNQTDLHTPFIGLQEVVKPYSQLLEDMPNSWPEALCGKSPDSLCKVLSH